MTGSSALDLRAELFFQRHILLCVTCNSACEKTTGPILRTDLRVTGPSTPGYLRCFYVFRAHNHCSVFVYTDDIQSQSHMLQTAFKGRIFIVYMFKSTLGGRKYVVVLGLVSLTGGFFSNKSSFPFKELLENSLTRRVSICIVGTVSKSASSLSCVEYTGLI